MKKRGMVYLIATALAVIPGPLFAQDFAQSRIPEIIKGIVNLTPPRPEMNIALLAKAKPDECYNGIGEPYPPISPNGKCSAGIPKRNQSYVWGTAQQGEKIWFGTVSNMLCQVASSLASLGGSTDPFQIETDSVVCEGLEAASGTGDLRPAKIYRYNLAKRTLRDVTPPDVTKTSGLRSAGAHAGIVFLAGPGSLEGGAGITMFAFHSDSETYLGSRTFPEYTDIRKWLVVKDVLYTAVQNADGTGSILRWSDAGGLWNFEVVGRIPNSGANMSVYGSNRIAVSTWPSLTSDLTNPGAGVYISPEIPCEGLSTAHADSWKEVFLYRNYEPDLAVARSYFGGDLAFFRGWLYWGSMHVPGISAAVHSRVYGSDKAANQADQLVGTWRATSVWRGKDLHTDNPQIELLYGESELAKYDWNPLTQTGTKKFNMVPTGWTPLYGKSGFGNIFNGYTWTMAVANNSLFIGTLDISYLMKGPVSEALRSLTLPVPSEALGMIVGYGADIWRFDSNHQRAQLESRNGAGNAVNYGIRTMNVAPDGRTLYLGTANPFNIDPKGGWELLKLTPKRQLALCKTCTCNKCGCQ